MTTTTAKSRVLANKPMNADKGPDIFGLFVRSPGGGWSPPSLLVSFLAVGLSQQPFAGYWQAVMRSPRLTSPLMSHRLRLDSVDPRARSSSCPLSASQWQYPRRGAGTSGLQTAQDSAAFR
jgi:hypothetical protein